VIAAVVLAGGASRRLGEPKQLVKLGEETLLERTVRVAYDARLAPVVVVLGCQSEQILAASNLGNASTVVNNQWEEGMASSIRLGVGVARTLAPELEGLIILACDQPAVTSQHLRSILSGTTVTASGYGGRSGVPAYFPAASLEELMNLLGDAGARELLRTASTIELSHGDLDVDTQDDLQLARTLFR
jgi:molybdenum cofactor cytidylyltransferase